MECQEFKALNAFFFLHKLYKAPLNDFVVASLFRLYVDENKYLYRHGLTIDLNESQDNKPTKFGTKILT